MKRKRKKRDRLLAVLFAVLSVIVLFPAVYVLCNSFMSPQEAVQRYGARLPGSGTLDLSLLPETFSVQGYVQVFLRRTAYWLRFWRTLAICGAIVAGQLLVSILGGFAFAKYSFPGRRWLFYLLVVLMLMPVQVTLGAQLHCAGTAEPAGQLWRADPSGNVPALRHIPDDSDLQVCAG